jgi:hypothetical protein
MPTTPISTSAAAVVQEFPPELLSNIFSLSVSKPVQIPASCYDAPWNIAQVCSKWRHVALEIPSLWNDIQILLDYSSAETQESCDSMLKEASLFLFRSGKSPISLTLEAEEDVTPHACMAVLFFVMPHLRRLQSLSLIPVERFRLPPQLDWGRVNNLESLSLSFDFGPLSGNLDHPPASYLKGFHGASKLHTLTISSDHAHLELQIFKFPWSQLTRLEFNQTTIPYAEGHEVLRQCVGLVSLRLGIVSDDECKIFSDRTLLPHLESLAVFVDMDGDYGQFLQPFVLPSLKRLKIESEDESFWSDDEGATLNTESLKNLEQLAVTHMEPTAIHALLTDAPSLIELSMRSFTFTDALEELTEAICDGDIAPILRVLECDAGMVDSLVNILEARAKVTGDEAGDEVSTSATIESVIIHGDLADMPVAKELLTVFRSQGIDVRYEED